MARRAHDEAVNAGRLGFPDDVDPRERQRIDTFDPLIVAVVVAFHPEEAALTRLLQKLGDQVGSIVVVDNTPGQDDGKAQAYTALPSVEWLSLGFNAGIASALNIGVRRATEIGATYVLFSDQDSDPEPEMVSELLKVFLDVQMFDEGIAAVGPSFLDAVTAQEYRFQVRQPGARFYLNATVAHSARHMKVVSLITSGSLVSLAALEQVGLMNPLLFIDHVDTEWCLRARSKGFSVYAASRARMQHAMGADPLHFRFFGRRTMAAYPPSRLYYRVRNFLYIVQLPHVPAWWIARAWRFVAAESIAHLWRGSGRLDYLRMVFRGALHGLLGRLGPI